MRLRFLLVTLLPLPLPAQAVRDSVVSVTASRTAKVAPDRASFYLIIEGTAETPADAIARVDTKLKAVLEALKSFGPRVVLDTPIAYGVGPSPAPNGYPTPPTPATNLARSVVRVQLNRPEQLGNVVAAAIGAGAATSSSLAFESSVADSIRRARIGEVLGAARTDAETIASALGARLGTLVGVTTSGTQFGFQGPSYLTFDTRFGQQSATPEVTVVTTVTVQYHLIR